MSAKKKDEKAKTPGLLWFKEIITATLAGAIIGVTLCLLIPRLSTSPIDKTSAEGIFSILGGWGGVVLGYYFGRMPAERAADKAEVAAEAAEKNKDEAEIREEYVRGEADKSLTEIEIRLEGYETIIKKLIQKMKET